MLVGDLTGIKVFSFSGKNVETSRETAFFSVLLGFVNRRLTIATQLGSLVMLSTVNSFMTCM